MVRPGGWGGLRLKVKSERKIEGRRKSDCGAKGCGFQKKGKKNGEKKDRWWEGTEVKVIKFQEKLKAK